MNLVIRFMSTSGGLGGPISTLRIFQELAYIAAIPLAKAREKMLLTELKKDKE
jgi:hypothetical protein